MTLTEINTYLKETYVSERAAAGLVYDNPDNWSIYNLKRLQFFVVAVAMYLQQEIFTQLKIDTDSRIYELKPHSPQFYANLALNFQLGFNLLPDSDKFDNTGATADQIAASKIVKYAAVVKQDNIYGRRFLRIKLAKDVSGELAPLSNVELTAVRNYFERVGDAGVRLVIESLPADSLKAKLKIYYNPLILNNTGSRIDGSSSEPVQTAIKAFLKTLPFNGVFVLQKFIDAIQEVTGVETLDYEAGDIVVKYGLLPYAPVDVFYVPDSGYLRFTNPLHLELEFEPFNVI